MSLEHPGVLERTGVLRDATQEMRGKPRACQSQLEELPVRSDWRANKGTLSLTALCKMCLCVQASVNNDQINKGRGPVSLEEVKIIHVDVLC